jgi:hypothetical protein
MQNLRKSLALAAICGIVLSTGALAASDNGPRQPRETPKQQKPAPKGLIRTILDYVENQFSLPPG